ncbi:MAG: M14 family metallopeptidase [Chitinophagales bacterium]|nr:M14 family metallopeptidase [Chitinophagales bacterium]
MLRLITSLIAILCCPFFLNAQLLSPSEFLPHDHGDQFTPHHMVVDYVYHVAENSPKVKVEQYGLTNEDRPLLLVYISSEENLEQLDAIRQNNLRKTGLLNGSGDTSLDRAIVWLSFGVHGNEAGASESSMSTLYELVRPGNSKMEEWLKNTIILLDPSLNPDGYSRYTHWYRGVSNLHPSPENDTREHNEPWPGGRVNHYLFDLNRDWAWQTQVETQQRNELYLQWMPHIHVDYHEQYPNSPYYFAPAAAPFHEYINEWQRDFQLEIGHNHARYFDREGWLYFTREIFDLFYPSYGDTYPLFHGAIGMTHEQAGHGIAGRAYIMENHDTLTLADRIAHHTSTAMSTVEMASVNADRIVKHFEDYYDTALNNSGNGYKTYIVKADNPIGRMKALLDLLDRNQIQYYKANSPMKVNAYHYLDTREGTAQINEGDLIIPANQPMSVMTKILFEPEPFLEDSLTYDITAWALPYAYGLEAYATNQKINTSSTFEMAPYTPQKRTTPYAFAIKWDAFSSAKVLAALLKEDIRVRYSNAIFTLEGQEYPRGTLLITQADNRKNSKWASTVTTIADQHQQNIQPISTGFSDSGTDLGSSMISYLEAPKIALLSGESTSPYSFGEMWYFFERNLEYPVDVYNADQLSSIDLSNYNTLILPEGGYRWNDALVKKVDSWIKKGGKLIAVGGALNSLAGKDAFAITSKNAPVKEETTYIDTDHHYAGQARRAISSSIPGAIFNVHLDNTHPLAYGLGGKYHTLKTSSNSFELLDDGWNAAYLKGAQDPVGFAGSKALKRVENSLVFGLQEKGSGSVIYLVDDPLFRGFWENGKLLFSNALFMAN